MRRSVLIATFLAGIVPWLVLFHIAGAQEGVPGATFPTSMDVPELRVIMTDTGFEAPGEIPADRVLLIVENATTYTHESADANLLLPPPDTTMEDVTAVLQIIESEATPNPAILEGGMPAWFYAASWAGGVVVPPGQTMQAIVELTPGEWILLNDNPGAPQTPQYLTVLEGTASPEAKALELNADVRVELAEMAFGGLDSPIPAGPRLWKLTNTGEQPHLMRLIGGPPGITPEEMMRFLQLPADAPLPPDFPYQVSEFTFDDPGLALLSAGKTSWLALDLEPGTYIAVCLVPDEKTGVPAALMGMVHVFTVTEPVG